MTAKVLFIIKRRLLPAGTVINRGSTYSEEECINDAPEYTNTISSGLVNSANFVVDMLVKHGIVAKLVQVVDNNCIDREVKAFKPTHVIVEAFWVVPEKFTILAKLHPNVKWVIRNHSETPFLANEGMAMRWMFDYLKQPNTVVSTNSTRAQRELSYLLSTDIPLLLNYYPTTNERAITPSMSDEVDVCCFGAIRPLKNHLMQALAAIKFADGIGKKLNFHVNVNREEQKGLSVLNNLRGVFNNLDHDLVEHPWMNHDDFIKLVKTMDIGMQVSFTETFNIVAADLVNNHIPIVVSPEIFWATGICKADPTDFDNIVATLHLVWKLRRLKVHHLNKCKLERYNDEAICSWLTYLRK